MKRAHAVKIKDYLGNREILSLPKTAFLCSRKIPASIVLKCYDWAVQQRQAGNCVISGFHSEMEKDVFHFLARGKQPIILVLHKGLPAIWDPALEKMLKDNRLLIITPFCKELEKGTEDTAMIRNHLALDLADDIRLGHVAPGGNLEKLIGKRRLAQT